MNTSSPVLASPNRPIREQSTPYEVLVAIAPDIANRQQLAAGVRPGVSVLLLDAKEDAIAQIRCRLQQYSHPVSLHLITHGAPGYLQLGATPLTAENLDDWAQQLQTWRERVSEILLYGCEVAVSQGKGFVNRIAKITGANIAASETVTGNAALGGNWNLEYATGEIQASLAFQPEVLTAYEGIFFDRTVNDVTELIQAINDANDEGTNPGADTIRLAAGVTYGLTNFFFHAGNGLADGQVFPVGNNQVLRGFVGLPRISSTITIEGNGATIARSGGSDFRLFYVDGEGSSGNLTLNNLTLSGGKASSPNPPSNSGNDGGAIWSTGTVTINKATIQNNEATDDGGAIANFGIMTITDSIIQNNKAGDGGGGIANENSLNKGGQLTLIRTTISGNTAADGGGIRNEDSGALVRENSPISGNTLNDITNTATNLASDIEVRDGATPISDGSTGVNLGSLNPGQTKTLTIANTGNFDLDIRNITLPAGFSLVGVAPTTIASGATQDIVIGGTALEDGGVQTGSLSIVSNDGDNAQNPYDFTFSITVNGPEINVLDPNNNNVPTGTGNFNFGTVTPGTTFPFTIQNTGTQALNLSNLQLPDGLVLAGNFPTTLAPGASIALPLQISPNFSGAFNGTIRFNSNDFNEGSYEFAIAGTVATTPPGPGPGPGPGGNFQNLTNIGDNVFVIGNGGQTNLTFQLNYREARFINEMGVFRVGANNEILDFQGNSTGITPGSQNYTQAALTYGNAIFSAVPTVTYNDGLITRTLSGLTDGASATASKFNAGDRLAFYLISNGTTDGNLSGRPPAGTALLGSTFGISSFQQLRTNALGTGAFLLSWEDGPGGGDGDFNDMAVTVKQTTQTSPLGATVQGSFEGEVLDLRSFNTAKTVRFTVFEKEASFNNRVGLYRVDLDGQILNPTTGEATGVRVGAGNYKDVALANRVGGLNLSSNTVTSTLNVKLEAGTNALYAPFIIANGDTNNVFFPFLGSNSDGVDHVRLLADNTFGFEDFAGGFDFDYNDFVFKAEVVA